MTLANTTLCAPDGDKSCFACCPPIRPAGYDHNQHKNILKREFRENTLAFKKDGTSVKPITGFSCWALGYLDNEYRRIGCLLHPLQNQGTDLRFRVDYGEKCRRESCPESVTFSRLNVDARRFWLHLADGLDSFAYSSRKENPLFTIMAWGKGLLELIPSVEGYHRYEKKVFLREYPFFQPNLAPRPHAYPAERIMTEESVSALKKPEFREEFLRFSRSLSNKIRRAFGDWTTGGREIAALPRTLSRAARNDRLPRTPVSSPEEEFERERAVHRLPLDRDFLDFLRLSVGITRISKEDALRLKAMADEDLERFRRSLNNLLTRP